MAVNCSKVVKQENKQDKIPENESHSGYQNGSYFAQNIGPVAIYPLARHATVLCSNNGQAFQHLAAQGFGSAC